jgi:2-oxoglutarate/2-oxoacid ferredoxin oxidoreductase subunit alpha
MSTQLLHDETSPVRTKQAEGKSPEGTASTAVNGQEPRAAGGPRVMLNEHIVEILSDSGEGAQRCGQSFAAIAARMGMGIWTVEIIPAEIQPPARSIEGASGNRIRLASRHVSNGGDQSDLVVAFNEQALLGRIRSNELKQGCIILLESQWRASPDAAIAAAYARTHRDLVASGFKVHEIPMERECLRHVADARRGKNMFALGMLCGIYGLDPQLARQQMALAFAKKDTAVIDANRRLLDAGFAWAETSLDVKFTIPTSRPKEPQLVVNGNIALGLGALASGMRVCSMYPITPATSVSHYLSEAFEKVGGFVHQAEDEIAACCFAIGASYAGPCALTITSGPGFSLKQEAMGLAVMAEIPLVVVNVQRGGPSTGLPTKSEQGDLLTACFGGHGDSPKVVMAAATIEDCFYAMLAARKIAETFNVVVVVLTDANLATAQQPFPRPRFQEDWLAPPLDQSAIPEGAKPYDWDPHTGLSPRFIPGQPKGMHCVTGLAHDRMSRVAYDPDVNQEGVRHRSLKLAALQKTLKAPPIFGDELGELLIVGWGSTKGAIEEAVERVRAEGRRVSSLHLTFLQPMASGIKEILGRFDRVMTVESSWCDNLDDAIINGDNRRYSGLAWLLRAKYLVDVDCWSEVRGQPLKPATIARVIREKLP